MAFRKKASLILQYQPDILIIPECEHPDRLKFPPESPQPTDALWFGKNPNKGLGIFSYSDFKLRLIEKYNPKFRFIIPIKVTRKKFNFILYAIWANNPDDPDGQYVTQVWKALTYYEQLIRQKRTVLIGDFNSNMIWDQPKRKGNHSHVVELLQSKKIHSTYHMFFNQVQGREAHPTFYLYKNIQKPYHLDYCFASEDMIESLQSVEVGDYISWKQFSDHVPLIVTFAT